MERNKEIASPLHLIRCAYELGKMAVQEALRTIDGAMDVFEED